MANYAKHISQDRQAKKHQQVQDRPDQVKNNAGGFVYALSEMEQLDRFLIIGASGGSYYASEKKITIDNAKVVQSLIASGHGREVVDRIAEISEAGRAFKNDQALFALAICLSCDDVATKQYAVSKIPQVARIGTHLFTLVDYCNSLRRWGRGLRRAVAAWYNGQDAGRLAHQVCKYQSRTNEGSQTWSHLDLLKKAHVQPSTPAHQEVLRYVSRGWTDDQIASFKPSKENPFSYIWAHEKAKKASSVDEIVQLINKHGLVRESIPTTYLNDIAVWDALLDKMPYTAMIRNLATMTDNGLLNPDGALSGKKNGNNRVIAKLLDGDSLRKARVHPLTVLQALRVYGSGHGVRGGKTWTPVQSVMDALDEAFYLAFKQMDDIEQTVMFSVDCSGSMSSPVNGMNNISSRDAAAALALVFMKKAKNSVINGFTSSSSGSWYNRGNQTMDGISPLAISPNMRLDSVAKVMNDFSWGSTDCALPMIYAKAKNLKVQNFVIITDNETWAGAIKPDQALREYRQSSGIHNAKLIVIGTQATPFSIGDPNDKYTLNIAGFDSNAPTLLHDFINGKV